MKTHRICCLLFLLIAVSGCVKDDYKVPGNGKQLNQVVIVSTDYIGATVHETTAVFDYSYDNNKVKEIAHKGKKHITFVYEDDVVVEKKYFNDKEEVVQTETFTYDRDKKLTMVNLYNRGGSLIHRSEIMFTLNRPSLLNEAFFFPTTEFQEYVFKYSESDLDSVYFTNLNQTYVCEYHAFKNIQDLEWFITKWGVYPVGQFTIGGTTVPVIFGSNAIKSIRGFDASGNQTFAYQYEHRIINGSYVELSVEWFDRNQVLLNSTNVEFKY